MPSKLYKPWDPYTQYQAGSIVEGPDGSAYVSQERSLGGPAPGEPEADPKYPRWKLVEEVQQVWASEWGRATLDASSDPTVLARLDAKRLMAKIQQDFQKIFETEEDQLFPRKTSTEEAIKQTRDTISTYLKDLVDRKALVGTTPPDVKVRRYRWTDLYPRFGQRMVAILVYLAQKHLGLFQNGPPKWWHLLLPFQVQSSVVVELSEVINDWYLENHSEFDACPDPRCLERLDYWHHNPPPAYEWLYDKLRERSSVIQWADLPVPHDKLHVDLSIQPVVPVEMIHVDLVLTK